ncbi:uncharacterized protein LOC125022810 [Mugil cephalus]|uniref:uncharacterized protein LOC125022810 n=1 Tax=Mugil cephalus TaxID=48193 RepID=UPI001FB686A1|nr:uncharacterized protein LOC125022810 [Mugil cephalus]
MLSRIFFACLLLGLYSSASSLSCRWMNHKFRQYSENSLALIDAMVSAFIRIFEDSEAEDAVVFPYHLYSQASGASAEDKLAFTVQVLKEVAALFEEDYSSASWEESTVENFLNVVNRQADGLHFCIGGHHRTNAKLHMYFRRLSHRVLKRLGHSSEAWELVRKEIKAHLMRVDQLGASLLTSKAKPTNMLSRIFFACLLLGLYSSGSSLSCRWMNHKFKQYSENSLDLIDAMANNSTNSTEDAGTEDTVVFPYHLYSHASKASAGDKLAFTVQVLKEVAALFEEDYSSASWEESTVENFLNVVNKQADELNSCIVSHTKNKKLEMYFKKLSNRVLKQKGHSSEAWELVREEIKAHLMRVDQLGASLLTSN